MLIFVSSTLKKLNLIPLS